MTSRDEELVRALYAEHAAALWSFVVPLVGGDRVRAQDVVQETMLRAWRRADVLDQSRGSVRPWLFTVARNIVVDEWRRHRTDRDVPLESGAEAAVDDRTDAVLDTWIVGDALTRLSADLTLIRGAIAEGLYKRRVPVPAALTKQCKWCRHAQPCSPTSTPTKIR